MLPVEAIEEFKIIYSKILGVALDTPEALKKAENLYNLIKVVYQKPIDPQRKTGV